MTTCTICHQPIEGPGLEDDESGAAFHSLCVASQGLDELATGIGIALAAFVVTWGS